MLYALAIAVTLSFFHLTLGALIYAPAVMAAYEALDGRSQDIIFMLGMFGAISGKAIIVIADKKFLPQHFLKSWKENLLQVYVYLVCSFINVAWLWYSFKTGFFTHLESSMVFVAIITIATMYIVGQTIYWILLFFYNFTRRRM